MKLEISFNTAVLILSAAAVVLVMLVIHSFSKSKEILHGPSDLLHVMTLI